MPDQNKEILSIILIGGLLALGLLLFVVIILFIYQKRQHAHEKEMVELKEKHEKELLRSQVEIQEKTLQAIGQELHDNIAAQLQLLMFPVSALTGAEFGNYSPPQFLKTIIDDVRHLAHSLHSDRIANIGIRMAIEFEVKALRKTNEVGIDFEVNDIESKKSLNPEKTVSLFRMFQESLNNALKHSKATHIKISLLFSTDDTLTLIIKDNGIGFNVAEKQHKPSASGGVGLMSMPNRAESIGAAFLINSGEGKGTTVTIVVPLS
jgi:signal transduction histidine kinase